MIAVTLRLSDRVIRDVDTNAHLLHLNRSEYIRKAILELNHDVQERGRRQRLMAVSQRVRQESMKINAEFAAIENDPEA